MEFIMEKSIVTLQLDSETIHLLDTEAQQKFMDRSKLIRFIIAQYFKTQGDNSDVK